MIIFRIELLKELSFVQKSVLFNLLLLSDDNGVSSMLEGEFSAYSGIPRTSLRQVLEALKDRGFINFKTSEQTSKGRKKKLITICNYASYKTAVNFNENFKVSIDKPLRGELSPYIKSKGYKFTSQSFTSYEDSRGWIGNQGDTWKDLVDRFAITEEAAASANRRNTFKAPTVEAAEGIYREGGYHFDLNQFYNHYSSNGWMVGRVKMCDLNATMRTWENELKKKNPELFIEKKEKTDREIQYEEAMNDKFPRLMQVAYPLTLTQYEYLKGVALERNEIDKLVSVLTRFNGSDLSRIRVAYDSICAAMNYPKI